jgi:hypothetical protein
VSQRVLATHAHRSSSSRACIRAWLWKRSATARSA